jgi:hypothetical protein
MDKMKYMLIDNEYIPQIGVLDDNITNTEEQITSDLYTYLQLIQNQNELLKNKLKHSKLNFAKDEQKNYYKTELNSSYGTISAYLLLFYYILLIGLCYEIFFIQTNMDDYNKYGIIVNEKFDLIILLTEQVHIKL